MDARSDTERRSTLAVGVLLVIVGLVFLVARSLDVSWDAWWPVFVIAPGIALLTVAVVVGGPVGAGFAVPGGIVTMVGVVLAIQQATGLWATWSYAWALVAPGGVGLGLLVHGLFTGQRELIDSGLRTIGIGVALFIVFGLFFEAVVGVSGTRVSGVDLLAAGAAVVLGVVFVGYAVLRRRPPA